MFTISATDVLHIVKHIMMLLCFNNNDFIFLCDFDNDVSITDDNYK